MAKINRSGLKTLVQRGYTNSELADAFSLSRTWVIQIVNNGREPRHPGIIEYVNDRIKKLLAASA
jgi:hypothetical protein